MAERERAQEALKGAVEEERERAKVCLEPLPIPFTYPLVVVHT